MCLILKKVCNDGRKPHFFQIIAQFGENSVNFTFLEASSACTSHINQKCINELSTQHQMNSSDYYLKLKEYIKDTPAEVTFSLCDGEFVIFRNLENKIRMKYFVTAVKKANYEDSVEKLLNEFYSDNLRIAKRLNQAENQRDNLSKTKSEYESKLKEFIERKKSDDEQLYGSFMLVLNEKKLRIQHLNELLEAFKSGRPSVNAPTEVKGRKRKKNQESIKVEKKEVLSETESDGSSENYQTDEDVIEDVNSEVAVDPSTSKATYNFLNDDSPRKLLLPKRIKSTTPIEFAKIPKDTVPSKKEDVSKEQSQHQSPTVDFSTQELLDAI